MATNNVQSTHPVLSDKPTPSKREIGYGSDVIAEQLSRLDLKYLALVPGSSYRGLHDSLVNYNGNSNPEMIVCLHEEHAVAIAHGYAKVTRKPLGVALHANVGLMHATMAIFNAFTGRFPNRQNRPHGSADIETDRVPILILGATGPLDATKRRPWIDWLHTATDQAAMIRQYIKWDDQPHSANAAAASLVHGYVSASTKPCGPTYVCLDLGLQESSVDPETIHFPDTDRLLQIRTPGPSPEDVADVNAVLRKAKRPLFLLGRMGASPTYWAERVQLAKRCGAKVITDLKQIAPFPTSHMLHAAAPSIFVTPAMQQLIREADVILSADWIDLDGAIKASYGPGGEVATTVIHVSLDSALHNGWSKDHFGLPPADIIVHADPDRTVTALLAASTGDQCISEWPPSSNEPATDEEENGTSGEDIYMTDLAQAMYRAIAPDDMCLVRVPLGWKGADLRATHPLSFMGMDGGAGIGSGCGQLVGTSLALRETGSDLLAVAVLGDGDFAMGSSALWTAARYRLPLLAIIANNASYYNDEVHQERVAKHRGRPVKNKWIGMRLDDPQPKVHKIAEGLGCTVVASEQIKTNSELAEVLPRAVEQLRGGKTVVLDVQVRPEGYAAASDNKS